MTGEHDLALSEFISKLDYKKMSKIQIANEKRWFTTQQNIQRRHERQKKIIDWFLRDPEAKYFVGMAAGAGAAVVGSVLNELLGEVGILGLGGAPEAEPPVEPVEPVEEREWWWWLIQPGGLTGVIMTEGITGLNEPKGGSGPLGMVPNLMQLTGLSFSAACAAILVLRAIFSGTDLGELLGGVGEIVPL